MKYYPVILWAILALCAAGCKPTSQSYWFGRGQEEESPVIPPTELNTEGAAASQPETAPSTVPSDDVSSPEPDFSPAELSSIRRDDDTGPIRLDGPKPHPTDPAITPLSKSENEKPVAIADPKVKSMPHLAELPDPLAGQTPGEPVSANTPETQPESAPPTIWPEVKYDPASVSETERVVAGAVINVNNQYITVDELLTALESEISSLPKQLDEKAFKMRVAKILRNEMMFEIQQRLMAAEAEKYLEEQAKKVVDAEMNKSLREMVAKAGTQEQLRQKCIREGTTLDTLLAQQRRALMIQFYTQSKFMPVIVVNRRMLWNYYRKHPEEFSSDKKVQMQIVAMPFKAFLARQQGRAKPSSVEIAAAKVRAREEIDLALSKLRRGIPFEKVVKDHSKGPRQDRKGLWPMMGKDNFREKIVEDVAFALPEGAVSSVVGGEQGFYIVKAAKVEPAVTKRFEDAQMDIEDKLKRDQFEKLRREYMKKLYSKAVISTPPDFLKFAVERATERFRNKQ